MKQEGKLPGSRKVSTRISMSNFSAEDYHGEASVAVNIPFEWELEPGTPKINHSIYADRPSPLTPPPSYSYFGSGSPSASAPKRPLKKRITSRTNFFNTMLCSCNTAAKEGAPLQPSLVSSLSSLWLRRLSVPSKPSAPISSLSRSSTVLTRAEENEDVSVLCFGGGAHPKRKCPCSSLLKAIFLN